MNEENTYNNLVEAFPLRPFKSEDDLDKAFIITHELLDRDGLTKDEEDYLNVLLLLVEAYEEVHHPIPSPTVTEMIEHLLEVGDMQQDVLLSIFNEEQLAAIMAGNVDDLTFSQVGKLAAFFHVEQAVFFHNK